MHIALVLMTGNPTFAGGVPSVVLQRARYLVSQGHEVSVVCRASEGFVGHREHEGFHIYAIPILKHRLERPFTKLHTLSFWFLRSLGKGVEEAHARRPIDLVDLQDSPAILGVGPFLKRHRIPMTLTVHSSALLNPAPRPWIGRRLHVLYERMATRRAKLILPVSQFIAEAPRRYGATERRLRVIPNTIPDRLVDLGSSRLAEEPHRPLRALFLASLIPLKRPDVAIDALAALPRGAIHLDIAGDGSELEACRERVARNGLQADVTFRGFVSDRAEVERLIAEADVFLFPTVFEAMSIALLEAMAGGLYPLASNIPAVTEVLDERLTSPVGDPAALAARLVELIEHPERIVAARGELVETARGYTSSAVYPRLMVAYEEAARA